MSLKKINKSPVEDYKSVPQNISQIATNYEVIEMGQVLKLKLNGLNNQALKDIANDKYPFFTKNIFRRLVLTNFKLTEDNISDLIEFLKISKIRKLQIKSDKDDLPKSLLGDIQRVSLKLGLHYNSISARTLHTLEKMNPNPHIIAINPKNNYDTDKPIEDIMSDESLSLNDVFHHFTIRNCPKTDSDFEILATLLKTYKIKDLVIESNDRPNEDLIKSKLESHGIYFIEIISEEEIHNHISIKPDYNKIRKNN